MAIKIRTKDDSVVMFESVTGQIITSLTSVTIGDDDSTIITVVYQGNIPYIYLPKQGMAFVTLQSAIQDYGLVINRVG